MRLLLVLPFLLALAACIHAETVKEPPQHTTVVQPESGTSTTVVRP